MTLNRGCPDERSIDADSVVLNDIQTIINRYKMSGYRDSYTDDRVMDGTVWKIDVIYKDEKQNISSSGCNAWPEGAREGFQEIRDYFRKKFDNQK